MAKPGGDAPRRLLKIGEMAKANGITPKTLRVILAFITWKHSESKA